MAKPKAQTLQQRFGFRDPELSTPKHDEMMLWLDSNIESVVNTLVYEDGWDIEWLIQKEYEDVTQEDLRALPVPSKPSYKVVKKIWEHPITTQQSRGYGNKYTVGFADMLVAYEKPYLALGGIEWPSSYSSRKPRRKEDEPLHWFIRSDREYLLFEVKPAIPSLGELIRQIRHYETYIDIPFAVLCADDRFASQLIEQGINFFKYTGDHG